MQDAAPARAADAPHSDSQSKAAAARRQLVKARRMHERLASASLELPVLSPPAPAGGLAAGQPALPEAAGALVLAGAVGGPSQAGLRPGGGSAHLWCGARFDSRAQFCVSVRAHSATCGRVAQLLAGKMSVTMSPYICKHTNRLLNAEIQRRRGEPNAGGLGERGATVEAWAELVFERGACPFVAVGQLFTGRFRPAAVMQLLEQDKWRAAAEARGIRLDRPGAEVREGEWACSVLGGAHTCPEAGEGEEEEGAAEEEERGEAMQAENGGQGPGAWSPARRDLSSGQNVGDPSSGQSEGDLASGQSSGEDLASRPNIGGLSSGQSSGGLASGQNAGDLTSGQHTGGLSSGQSVGHGGDDDGVAAAASPAGLHTVSLHTTGSRPASLHTASLHTSSRPTGPPAPASVHTARDLAVFLSHHADPGDGGWTLASVRAAALQYDPGLTPAKNRRVWELLLGKGRGAGALPLAVGQRGTPGAPGSSDAAPVGSTTASGEDGMGSEGTVRRDTGWGLPSESGGASAVGGDAVMAELARLPPPAPSASRELSSALCTILTSQASLPFAQPLAELLGNTVLNATPEQLRRLVVVLQALLPPETPSGEEDGTAVAPGVHAPEAHPLAEAHLPPAAPPPNDPPLSLPACETGGSGWEGSGERVGVAAPAEDVPSPKRQRAG